MITIIKSRWIKETKKDIQQVIKTDLGIFLVKGVYFEDDTAQIKLYKISFDEMGDILCDSDGGVLIVDKICDCKSMSFFITHRDKITNEELLKAIR